MDYRTTVVFSFRTFSCLSLSRNSRSPFLVLPFLLSHRTRDTTAPSTRVAYVYVTLSPGPGRGASSNPCNLDHSSPFSLACHRLKTLVTSVTILLSRSRPLGNATSPSPPCAFSFPSGSHTHLGPRGYPSNSPAWAYHLRYTLNQGCVLFSGHANFYNIDLRCTLVLQNFQNTPAHYPKT